MEKKHTETSYFNIHMLLPWNIENGEVRGGTVVNGLLQEMILKWKSLSIDRKKTCLVELLCTRKFIEWL